MNRKKNWQVAIVVTLIGFSPIVGEAEPPTATPPNIRIRPVIDGKLDDECWKNAAKLADFHIYKSDKTTDDTRAWLARDDKFLYLGFKCFNPNMRFLNLNGASDDDAAICKDDSIEIFLQRDGMNRYFHYMLNYAGLKGERRVSKDNDGKVSRDLAWNYPWIAAVTSTDKSWTAEIAIPLDVLNYRTPGDVKMNILRNKIDVELDPYGAKTSETQKYHFWSPVKRTAHEPKSFGTVAGLKERNMAPSPLLIKLDGLKTGELSVEGDYFNFDVYATILGVSGKSGDVKVDIVEKLPDGTEKILVEKTYSLPPRCQKKLSIKVPVKDFSEKKLFLRVTDKKSGMPLQRISVPFSGTIMKEVYSEFSFYSFEKTLRIKAILDLTRKTLKDMSLTLKTQEGKIIVEKPSPSNESILSTSVNILKPGLNHFKVVLTGKNGKVFGSKDITIKRLKGQGNESKIDHFRRVVIFKGKPYFPFGMYGGGSFNDQKVVMDAYVKSLKSAKMNTLVTFARAYLGRFSKASIKRGCETLKQAGINVIIWGGMSHAIPKIVKENPGMSTEERDKQIRERYERKLLPNIRKCVEALKDQENFLAWKGLDESNLGNWQARLFAQKLFRKTMYELDPHHAMYGLYARSIPAVPEALKLFDFISYDIYTYPNWNNINSRPCEPTAAFVAQLDQRAATRRMPIWLVPQPTALDPGRCPLPLSGGELLCQAYTGMIYGAKGLVYFNYLLANSNATWNTLRTLGNQIEIISPALLNYPVKQRITYASGTCDAAHWKVPVAPFRLFRFSDGKLIALAVNSKNFPIDLKVRIKNLTGAKKIFGDKLNFEIKKNAFRDKLEPYGVRAYEISASNDPKKMVEVYISTNLYPKLAKSAPSCKAIEQRRKGRKNLVFNPSFEDRRKLADRPDFFMPYRMFKHHSIDDEPSDYFLDTKDVKFGKVSLRMTVQAGKNLRAGMLGRISASKNPDKPHVFSFYTKADKDDVDLWVGLMGGGKRQEQTIRLSTDWKRYQIKSAHSRTSFLMQTTSKKDAPRTWWIDGIQMEEGETPTKFSE